MTVGVLPKRVVHNEPFGSPAEVPSILLGVEFTSASNINLSASGILKIFTGDSDGEGSFVATRHRESTE